MAEITPIQTSGNGAVTFEKIETLPPKKTLVKSSANLSNSRHQCDDQILLSPPIKNRKKSYFTKPPTPQQIDEQSNNS